MEKIKLLLYCTKTRKRLFFDKLKQIFTLGLKKSKNDLNGKIVAECDFEVEEIRPFFHWCSKLENETCLSQEEVLDYLDSKDKSVGNPKRQDIVKLIDIKNLNIFDKPRELNECWANTNAWIFSNEKLYVAPQNMRYCGDWNLKKAILISIKPEWLCKILNGEKTIEVRKKVLKEMMPSGK